MSVTTFLSNEILWQTLTACIKAARRVHAAIAYFGQGGAKMLPLRNRDRLIVDMSLRAVRAGSTDPREVQKLVRRGVRAFNRGNLHAKVVIADNWLISGSANVSRHSKHALDEAAIITNDRAALRRAREFIGRLCTEPVRPEYLKECKRLYRPPCFGGERVSSRRPPKRAKHCKLWIVNLQESSVPESEIERYEQGEAKAKKLVKDEASFTTDSFHWAYKPRMSDELEFGDWVIEVMRYKDKSILVMPPGQFLLIDHYPRDSGSIKGRWVFHLEVPRRGERMTWKTFRRAAQRLLRASELTSPRTMPIRDVQAADSLLALWTPGGRVSRR